MVVPVAGLACVTLADLAEHCRRDIPETRWFTQRSPFDRSTATTTPYVRGGMDTTEILLDILVVLLAAKVVGELAERLGLPAVCGEIFAGMVIGPSVLGWVEGDGTLIVLGEIGVLLLLFSVGLETELADLLAVGRASLSVAVIGVAVPFGTGYLAAVALGIDSDAAIFVGAALTATSVGITARVFGDMRALTTIEARTVHGAAVADDVIGLIVLTVVVGIIADNNASAGGIALVIVKAIGFLLVASYLGIKFAPHLFKLVSRFSRSSGTLVAVTFAFMLGVAEFAHLAELAPIIGAFVAGLAMRATHVSERIHREFTPVGHLFIPVFFLQIGIEADVSQFGSIAVLRDAALLLVVAVAAKLVSAVVLRKGQGDRWLVGIGMIPRGEVGLIFATIGLERGIFGDDLYAAVLLVVIASTIITPPILKMRLTKVRERAGAVMVGEARAVDEWFAVKDGRFDLVDDPPITSALEVTFEAALLGRRARPGDRLLSWFGTLPDEPLTWDREARLKFFELLEVGEARSWRLLAVTGVLERAIPELADGLSHRQRDLSDLDPLGVYSLPRLSRLRELGERDLLVHPERVALAAFLLDMVPAEHRLQLVEQVLRRMGVSEATQASVAELLRDHDLLLNAATRFDLLGEENIAQFAAHAQTEEQARGLYVLALLSGDLESWELARLHDLHGLMRHVLRSDLGNEDASSVVEARRAEAMRRVDEPFVRDRINVAPRAYVLAASVDELVRHASMCEPPVDRRSVRVVVTALGERQWRIEFAARDRIGLIARESKALAEMGYDVCEALAVTWGDQQAVASFRTVTDLVPSAEVLQRSVIELLDQPVVLRRVADASVEFDDHTSPWHTVCRIESPDRRGLLQAVTAAFAMAGVSVHSARVVTQGDRATDVFELNQGEATKLSMAARAMIERALAYGVMEGKRRRF